MLTKNILLKHFVTNYKIKKFRKKSKELEKEILLKNYPLLESHTNTYKYTYKKQIIKKLKNFKKITIIGMGGSILGTEAIYQFLKHKIKKKFIFINNLNPKLVNPKEKSLNIIISKSGETLETISNFHILKTKSNKNKFIFITEKKDSYISQLANKIKSDVIEHKNFIGGRYSVLSEVGMLPAQLMGLKEKNFKRLNNLLKNKNFLKGLIINVENTLKLLKLRKQNSIILNYDESSDNFFRWYQQLIAESLGKKSKGIVPIVSSMPKDNHSLLQLYLDGPKNNFFTFFNVLPVKSDKINKFDILNKKKYLKNKDLYQIIDSQKKATMNVFKSKKIPFRSFQIIKRSEDVMGELFSFFVLETILLGKALKVNPFDQPSVELIKKETVKLLR